MERAGYAVSSYAAFEIDKFARAISRFNYPDIEHCGDVLDADFSRYEGYDLVIGGSPCTTWSISRANREIDKNGVGWMLFTRFADAVKVVRPCHFLYENVASMHKNIKAYISEELGCEPILINSALVSAQQRKRLYWTNIPNITQPQDMGILLKDILDTGMAAREKSYCIDANYYKGGSSKRLDNQSGKRQMVYMPIALADKSNTVLSSIHRENALSMVKRGKIGLLCASEVDFAINTPERIGHFGNGGQGERIYSVSGKSVSMKSNGGGGGALGGLYRINLPDGDYVIRKLSPIEAERCQTLSDNYTAMGIDDKGKLIKISNTQRYKAVGNGWTIRVISHIFNHMGL